MISILLGGVASIASVSVSGVYLYVLYKYDKEDFVFLKDKINPFSSSNKSSDCVSLISVMIDMIDNDLVDNKSLERIDLLLVERSLLEEIKDILIEDNDIISSIEDYLNNDFFASLLQLMRLKKQGYKGDLIADSLFLVRESIFLINKDKELREKSNRYEEDEIIKSVYRGLKRELENKYEASDYSKEYLDLKKVLIDDVLSKYENEKV